MSTHDQFLYRQALERDKSQCRKCKSNAKYVRHIVPLPVGGQNVLQNLISLCSECNQATPYWRSIEHGERTREAMAAAKARGVQFGGLRPGTLKRNDAARDRATADAERLRPVLAALQAQGASLREMGAALAQAGTTTRNGQPLSPSSVKLQLQRLGLLGQ